MVKVEDITREEREMGGQREQVWMKYTATTILHNSCANLKTCPNESNNAVRPAPPP